MPRHQPFHCTPPWGHPNRNPWQGPSPHTRTETPWSPFGKLEVQAHPGGARMGWIEGCCVKSLCRSLQRPASISFFSMGFCHRLATSSEVFRFTTCLSKRFVPPNKVAKPLREQGWVLLGTKKLIPQTPRLSGYGLMQQISKPPGKSLCPLAGPGSGAGRGRCWWTRCWSASLLLTAGLSLKTGAPGSTRMPPLPLELLGFLFGAMARKQTQDSSLTQSCAVLCEK